MRLRGIGIDVVSVARSARFLAEHGQRGARRLLARSERRRLGSGPIQGTALAKRFAAKEAFFKALGRPWMGLDGLRAIEVELLPRERFRASTQGFSLRRPCGAEGKFFRTRGRVGAHVMVWEA